MCTCKNVYVWQAYWVGWFVIHVQNLLSPFFLVVCTWLQGWPLYFELTPLSRSHWLPLVLCLGLTNKAQMYTFHVNLSGNGNLASILGLVRSCALEENRFSTLLLDQHSPLLPSKSILLPTDKCSSHSSSGSFCLCRPLQKITIYTKFQLDTMQRSADCGEPSSNRCIYVSA